MKYGIDFAQRLYSECEEERYYSEYDLRDAFTQGFDYAQRLYSEDDDKKKDEKKSDKNKENKSDLSLYKTNRGVGRAILIGGIIPGLVGRSAGNKEASKADREGVSDEEIIDRAKIKGTKVGAIAGTAAGIGTSLLTKRKLPASIGTTVLGSGLGALGGRLGAKKATEVRVSNRAVHDYKN